MKNDIIDSIEEIAKKIAEKYFILNQNKLQNIEIDEADTYPLISEFFEYNLSDVEIKFKDLKELMNKAFAYFYDKGIEAAIKTHFNLPVDLVYRQDDLILLEDPDFPQSVTLYINGIALLEISNSLCDFVINHKKEFDEEGDTVKEITERILLIAFQLGAALATQIVLKSTDFDIAETTNSNLKIDALISGSDMYTIACPFCNHWVYNEPKDKDLRHLAKIKNCPHIYLQFFEGKDSSFAMGDTFRETISEAADDFLSIKGDKFIMSLNNFFEKSEYGLDDFLSDLYVTKKISESDELLFLNILSEIASTYNLRVSACEINHNKIITYFMAEKSI